MTRGPQRRARGHAATAGGVLAAMLVSGIVTAATAQHTSPVRSAYTTIDLKACRVSQRHKDGNAWSCKGLPGWPLYVAEGDLRMFVSPGKNGDKYRAATQTLGGFNVLFASKAGRSTLEWRGVSDGRAMQPFATILRYVVDGPEPTSPKRQILVVTRVTPSEACHVAHIDATGGPAANETARRIADTQARTFNCNGEPLRLDASGAPLAR